MGNDEKKSNGVRKIGTYAFYGGALFFMVILLYASISMGEKTETANNSKVSTQVSTQIKSSQKTESQETKLAEKIQVFLFHGTNRCYSCITAGEYTKEIMNQNFSEELKSGKIEFREINVDLPENKEVATKFKAAGTSFFVNSINGGNDNIKEDTQIWRLVANKESFSNYLIDKLKDLIGNEASAQENLRAEKKDIVFYFDDNCPECSNIQKYLKENDVENRIGFTEKNINKNELDAQQMAEDAMYCSIDEEMFGVPFLWAEGKCYTGEKNITDFFKQKINSIK